MIQVVWFPVMCLKSSAPANSVVYIIIDFLIMYYPKFITHLSAVTESKKRIQQTEINKPTTSCVQY
jgi:hypothetical protein